MTGGTSLGSQGAGLSGKGNCGMYNQDEATRTVSGGLAKDSSRKEEYENSTSTN